MPDNSYEKIAQSIIHLFAFALIMTGIFLGAPDLFLYLSHHPPAGAGSLIVSGLLFLAGVILFWKSSALAGWLTRNLD
jgi:uncharacterized membrane protein HdeD (DUF308 family)